MVKKALDNPKQVAKKTTSSGSKSRQRYWQKNDMVIRKIINMVKSDRGWRELKKIRQEKPKRIIITIEQAMELAIKDWSDARKRHRNTIPGVPSLQECMREWRLRHSA